MIKPVYNKIVIKEIKEDVSPGGIIMPVVQENKYTAYGEVLAAGPGRITESGHLIECCVKVGDKVTFGLTGGNQRAKSDGIDVWVIADHEVLWIH
jgi:chaperonin GroES